MATLNIGIKVNNAVNAATGLITNGVLFTVYTVPANAVFIGHMYASNAHGAGTFWQVHFGGTPVMQVAAPTTDILAPQGNTGVSGPSTAAGLAAGVSTGLFIAGPGTVIGGLNSTGVNQIFRLVGVVLANTQ